MAKLKWVSELPAGLTHDYRFPLGQFDRKIDDLREMADKYGCTIYAKSHGVVDVNQMHVEFAILPPDFAAAVVMELFP